MKKTKLNYRIHNPNSAEATAEYIAKILVEANRAKIQALLAEAATSQQVDQKIKDAAE